MFHDCKSLAVEAFSCARTRGTRIQPRPVAGGRVSPTPLVDRVPNRTAHARSHTTRRRNLLKSSSESSGQMTTWSKSRSITSLSDEISTRWFTLGPSIVFTITDSTRGASATERHQDSAIRGGAKGKRRFPRMRRVPRGHSAPPIIPAIGVDRRVAVTAKAVGGEYVAYLPGLGGTHIRP